MFDPDKCFCESAHRNCSIFWEKLNPMHSERPELYAILAFLSAGRVKDAAYLVIAAAVVRHALPRLQK